MKSLARVLAIDDGYFKPRQKGFAPIVGVLSRLDGRVEGIVSTKVKVDGLDSTQKIVAMVKKTRLGEQAAYILLDGFNCAGFNFVDLPRLSKELGIPAIAVMRKRPSIPKIENALRKFRDKKKRLALIEKAGPIHEGKNIFFQCSGLDEKMVKTLLAKTTKWSNLPEPLRLAHLIASGTSLGESTRP